MTRLPYWIQRADFSATDHDPVDATTAIHIVQSHDWPRELQLEEERKASGLDRCPPGIGFMNGDRILHICPAANGTAMVHYHGGVRGVDVLTNPRLPLTDVPDYIQRFYADDHGWLAQQLPEGARPGRPAWQAPIAGAILLMLVGMRLAYTDEREITLVWLAGFAAAGALIGLLVALCDGPGPGTLISRFLALVSPVTMFLPFIGVVFTVVAYVSNRKHPGLYRTVTRVTLPMSIAISALFLWL